MHEENACLIDSLIEEYDDTLCMKEPLELCLIQSIKSPLNEFLYQANACKSLNSFKVIKNPNWIAKFEK